MPRHTSKQPPLTFTHEVAVYNLLRKGREIVAKGRLTADDADEFRWIMDWSESAFNLAPCFRGNVNV